MHAIPARVFFRGGTGGGGGGHPPPLEDFVPPLGDPKKKLF